MAADEDTTTLELAGHEVAVTHASKVVFPRLGATKLDLVRYYEAVAGPLLATMGGRPVLLQRFPSGAGSKGFFQKRVPASRPPWLQTMEVQTVNGTPSEALVVADIAHAAWAANLGCLGFHVWPITASRPDEANELRLDLDPFGSATFDMAREAAAEVRTLLGEHGIATWPKTTGRRGIHVYVRLGAGHDSYAVRSAAVAVARELERRRPDLCTAAWWKEERGDRIFVDFNQNAPHKTVFGAWSVRADAAAHVSTPFAWDELETIAPARLTLTSVPARLAERGDPWARMYDTPQELAPLLELHERDRAVGLLDAPWPPQYPKMPDEPPRVAPSRARRTEDDS